MRTAYLNYSIISVIFVLLVASCTNSSENQDNDAEAIENEVLQEIDSTTTQIYKFDNTLFSIPSPYEVSILMKKLNLDYNPSLINSVGNAQSYTDNFKKALNLGVYGADLAYLNMNKQIPEAAKYFATIKITAEELQLSGAFDMNTIQRVENNLGNEDSLLFILSKAYRNTDKYLKDNNRQDIGVLVITGGWIESLFFLAQVAQETQNEEVIRRLGEQKYPLENLIKILSPFYNSSDQHVELIDALVDLAYVFDGIDINYTYEEPVTDIANKTTTINSRSELLMNQEHVNMVVEKINKIRTSITD
ncbi:MAG: hypothetical protein JXR60_10695 [Bacteroidales bacterium]|nr:hypothetical protein [Bacteroidales bacterium]